MSESPQQPDSRDASVRAGDQAVDPTGDRASGQAGDQDGEPDTPSSLTFRITPISLLGVLALLVCATPLAWARPWLLSLYLIPLLVAVWILRVRTVVGANKVTARTMFGRSHFGWDEVTSFRLHERRWLRAVLGSGKEVQLPAVRVRDLPRLAAMSGGRLPDPTGSDASERDTSGQGAAEPGTTDADTTAHDAEADNGEAASTPQPDITTSDATEAEATPDVTPSDAAESADLAEGGSSRTQ